MAYQSGLKFSDLVDYEIALNRQHNDPIYTKIISNLQTFPQESSRDRIQRFIKVAQSTLPEPKIGPIVANWSKLVLLVAIVSAVISGAVTAFTFLMYDGSTPINIIPIIIFYVGFQLTLLLILCGANLFGSLLKSWVGPVNLVVDPILKVFHARLVSNLYRKLPKTDQGKIVMQSLKRFDRLYRPLEITLVKQYLQVFGVVFNVTGLMVFLYLGAFSDLAFAWSSTLAVDAEAFSRLLTFIAIPFSWMDPSIVPTTETVRVSEYVRLEGKYVVSGLADSLMSKKTAVWWSYSCLCILVYGVLPRFCLTLYYLGKLRIQLKNWTFQDHKSLSLLSHLSGLNEHWQQSPAKQGKSQSSNSNKALDNYPSKIWQSRNCLIIKWLDAPFDDGGLKIFLSETYGINALRICSSLGTDTDSSSLISEIKTLGNQIDAIIIVAEPWELPGQGIENLVANIDKWKSKETRILLCPVAEREGKFVPMDKGDSQIWRQSITNFDNPFIGLMEDYGVPS